MVGEGTGARNAGMRHLEAGDWLSCRGRSKCCPFPVHTQALLPAAVDGCTQMLWEEGQSEPAISAFSIATLASRPAKLEFSLRAVV